MRSDVARCLYGFSNAPLQATVTVTYGGGEAKIATQNMTETDGWLKLNAAGFTFSAPTIRVKLSQPKARTLGVVPIGIDVTINESWRYSYSTISNRGKD